MSRKRKPMRKIKTVLRLAQHEQLSERQIARAANMRRSTVRDYLERARAADLSWPVASGMDDAAITQMLFPGSAGESQRKALPDWGYIHTELRRKHVTLQLLWEEYRAEHPNGYRYSRFCDSIAGMPQRSI
jgi:transposase